MQTTKNLTPRKWHEARAYKTVHCHVITTFLRSHNSEMRAKPQKSAGVIKKLRPLHERRGFVPTRNVQIN